MTTPLARVSFRGALAATRVIPASRLGPGDRQSVSVFGTDGPEIRSLRLPYRAGGSTTYMLPTLVADLTWTTVPSLAVRWTSLAPATNLDAYVSPRTGAGPTFHASASPSLLGAAGATQLVFDTSMPGFQAAWLIDLTAAYERQFVVSDAPSPGHVAGYQRTEAVHGPPHATQRREVGRTPRSAATL